MNTAGRVLVIHIDLGAGSEPSPWLTANALCVSVSGTGALTQATLRLNCYVHYIYMRTQYFKLGGKHTCEGVTLPNIRRWWQVQRTVNRRKGAISPVGREYNLVYSSLN